MLLPTILFLLFTYATALPNGAPSNVCGSMEPFHGGGIPRQTSSSPFKVITFRKNDGIQVVVRSLLGIPFKGFMLQGRTPSGEVVGYFEPGVQNGHTIDCAQRGDTLTHDNTERKDVIDAQWSPGDYNGVVLFNATVAQEYDTFWVGIESVPVDLSKRSVDDVYFQPTFPSRARTTTPPYYAPETPRESATEFDPFYTGCDETKLCFGSPAGCISSKNCKAAVAVTVNGDKFDFELQATDNAAWVGVGLSDDTQMGDDSVIECVRETAGVDAYMSWTSPRPSLGVSRLTNPKMGITLQSGSVDDGVLYCKVTRDPVTIVNDKTFNLITDKYYLLVASGSNAGTGSVGFHDLTYGASGEAQALADVSSVAAASKLLLRLHGAFMLAAWIGAASIGILLARYYRQTWVGSTLCGKDQWFAWHRMIMVTTWALTMTAFVLIFVELKAWSAASNPHAILGLITTIICFLQPIGAYFRPHPGTPKRSVFNWIHWLAGNIAHILAIVTIFFAVKLNKAELPDWFDWIMVAFVAFHVIMHLILSIVGCTSEKSAERRVSSFPMRDLGGSGRTSAYSDRSADAPFSGARRFLLAIYIVVVGLISIVLIVITAVAPVDQFWDSLKSRVSSV